MKHAVIDINREAEINASHSEIFVFANGVRIVNSKPLDNREDFYRLYNSVIDYLDEGMLIIPRKRREAALSFDEHSLIYNRKGVTVLFYAYEPTNWKSSTTGAVRTYLGSEDDKALDMVVGELESLFGDNLE